MIRAVTTERKLLTVQEVANLMGVHAQTVRNWIAEGLIPAYRLNQRVVRVDRSDLELLKKRGRQDDPLARIMREGK